MAGAGTEVGRIHIKVTPDTTGFREALRRQLQSATAGLDAEIPANVRGGAKVEAELNALARNRKTRIEVDNSLAARALRQIQESLDKVRASGRNISLFEEAARGLQDKVRNIPLSPELARGWEEDIRMELLRMKALELEFGARVDRGQLDRATLASLARAQFLANARKIRIQATVDVDNNRFRRGISSALAGIKSALGSTGSGIASVMKGIGNGFLNAGESALAAAGKFRMFGIGIIPMLAIAALVPPALSLIAGSLTMLPGLLTGLLVPMAAVALGFDGIKKAAEETGLFDPTGGKFGDGGVGPALATIREEVSKTFQEGLRPAFQGIVDMLPSMTAGFKTVAQGLSDIGQQGVQGISNRLPQVQSILNNIGQGLSNAAPGIRDFTSAIIQLAEGLAQKFPNLGTAFSNMMNDFLGWVDEFTFKDPTTGASQFDAVLRGVKDTANALWGALGRIMGVSLDNLARPDFGEGMRNFFKAVEEFVANTLPTLQRGFEAIASLADGLSPVFRAMGLLTNGFDIVKDTFAAMGDGNFETPIKAIDDMNARILEAKQNGGSFWDQWVAGATETGSPGKSIFDSLPKNAGAVGQQSATQFTQSFNQNLPVGTPITGAEQVMAPVVAQAAQTGQQASEAFKGAMTAPGANLQQPLVQQLQTPETIAQAQQAGARVGEGLATGIQNMLTGGGDAGGVTSGLVGVLNTQMQQIATGMQQSMAAIGPQLQGAFETLKGALDTGFAAMTLIVSARSNALKSAMAQAFSQLPQAVAQGLQGVAPAVNRSMVDAANQVNIGGSQAANVASASFAQVPPAIQGAMAPAITAVASICQQLVSTALSFAGAMKSAGYSIGASFAEGIWSSGGLVSEAASGIMGAARGFFPNSPAKKGPFAGSGWVDKSGEAVSVSFADGIQSGANQVISTVRDLMQAVKDIFGDVSGLTLNFNLGGGSSGSGSFTSQLSGATSVARDFQSTMTESINPTRATSGEMKQQVDLLTQQLAVLEMRRKELEQSRIGLEKGQRLDGIKSELEAVRNQKLALGLEKDRLNYALKYGGVVDETNTKFDDQLKTLLSMPVDFARTTAQGVFGDMGISGSGAIPALANYGIEAASKYIFNVNSVDDAFKARDNAVNLEAIGKVGR